MTNCRPTKPKKKCRAAQHIFNFTILSNLIAQQQHAILNKGISVVGDRRKLIGKMLRVDRQWTS